MNVIVSHESRGQFEFLMSSVLDFPQPARKGLLDRIGATGSVLCAAHCAVLPLLLVVAPAIGAGFANPVFEIGFIAFASALGLASLVLGYRRHRAGRALMFLVPGIALLWCAALVDTLHAGTIIHAIAMTSGGSLVATAHVLNLRLAHIHREACRH
jgi:hypothetical protein